VVVVVSVMLKSAFLCRQFCLCDCLDAFTSFLAMFVLFCWILVSWFVFRSVEICRNQAFNSASALLENFGRPMTLDLARNGLVLVDVVASCRLLSLFPC
jgi:hypothetical protein